MSASRNPLVAGVVVGLGLAVVFALVELGTTPDRPAAPSPSPSVTARLAPVAAATPAQAPPSAEAEPGSPQGHTAALVELQAWSRLADDARADEAHLQLLERRQVALEEAAAVAAAEGDDAYADALLRRRDALADRYGLP